MPRHKRSTCPKRSRTELRLQPFPHPSPITAARCRLEATALPGAMEALTRDTAASAAAMAAITVGAERAAVAVEALRVLMVEVDPAEAVGAEAALTVAVVVARAEAEVR